MDEILLHNMKNKKPEKESDSDIRYDINPKDDEHVNNINLKEKGVEEDDSWKIQCAVIYRLTKKYIIDKNILKVADLETFYNKKLKRHTANDELLGSETESPSDHISSQSSQNTMQSTSRTMDNLCIDIDGLNFSFSQKSLPRPEYSCNIEEGTSEENQVAILDRSILESKEPVKMTGLQREMAIAKFEVELYILEANSNKLAVEIIPQS